MNKILLAIFLAFSSVSALFFGLQNVSDLYAQQDSPLIESYDLDTTTESKPISIKIFGIGFNDQTNFYFVNSESKSSFLLTKITASDERVQAEFAAGLPAGQYHLCVDLTGSLDQVDLDIQNCSDATINVTPLKITDLLAVEPREIYQEGSRTIVITGTNFYSGTEPIILIGGQEAEQTEVVAEDITITTIISTPVLDEGLYDITVEFPSQSVNATLENGITVLPTLSHNIGSIEPQAVLEFQETMVFTITGSNVGFFTDIDFHVDGPYHCSADSNCVKEKSDNQIAIIVNKDEFSGYNPGLLDSGTIRNWTMTFPDGSTEQIPIVDVVGRSWPWDLWSWLVAGFVILIIFVWMFASYDTANEQVYTPYQQEKRIPKTIEILRLLIDGKNLKYSRNIAVLRLLLTFFVILVLYYIVFAAFVVGKDFRPVPTFGRGILLIGLNIGSIYVLTKLNGKFYQVVPSWMRYLLAAVVLAATLLIPIVLQGFLLTNWTIYLEIGMLLIVIWPMGITGLKFAEVQLERVRDKVTDDEVDVTVETLLFRHGEISVHNDQLTQLPRGQVIGAMARYFAAHRDNQGVLFSETEGSLGFVRGTAVQDLTTAFQEWRNNLDDEIQSSKFVKQLNGTLGFQKLSESNKPDNIPPGFDVFSVASYELESVLPTPFPEITFASAAAISGAQVKEFAAMLNRMHLPSRFAVVLTANNPEINRSLIRKELVEGIVGQNIVVLGEQDCKNILAAKDEIRLAFMRTIQEQVDLTIFSPYRTEMPTPPDMFYGRRQEIKRILEQISESSVAVLGARRSGKTSLLHMVQNVLVERGNLLLYLDCYAANDYASFFNSLEADWQFLDLDPNNFSLPGFRHLVNSLQKQHSNQKIVFQFDEIDRLLAFDNAPGQNENLFRMFRSLAQEQKCQFIFSGERTILEELSNPKSAFYNFPSPVSLGLLDRETTEDLVTKPMALVGVQYEDQEGAVEFIYEHTYGHPNLIQFLCDELLSRLSQNKTRSITSALIQQTCDDTAYRDKFVETFWSQATPLEKAISGSISEIGPASQAEVMERLQKAGFEPNIYDLRTGLRYLELSQLVKTANDKYEIRPQKFTDFLMRMGYDQWYKQWLYDHKQQLLEQER